VPDVQSALPPDAMRQNLLKVLAVCFSLASWDTRGALASGANARRRGQVIALLEAASAEESISEMSMLNFVLTDGVSMVVPGGAGRRCEAPAASKPSSVDRAGGHALLAGPVLHAGRRMEPVSMPGWPLHCRCGCSPRRPRCTLLRAHASTAATVYCPEPVDRMRLLLPTSPSASQSTLAATA
jgi:hypothetical protein